MSQRQRTGPFLLRQGFRPFFLGAGAYGALAMALWLAMLDGRSLLPGDVDPLAWHQHEMVFGVLAAAMAGFLLTAIPNWTGRLPVQGLRLGVLAGCWLAGRIAMVLSGVIGPAIAGGIDAAFLFLLAGTALREVIAGRNWRNLAVVVPVLLFAVANVLFHVGAAGIADTASSGITLSLFVMLALLSLIGGRIVPSFTRNWLARQAPGPLPAPPGRFDAVAIAGVVGLAVAVLAAPSAPVTGGLAIAVAVLHAVRLARWQGLRTLSDPLLAVLHLAYLWMPVGFLLLGLSVFVDALPASASWHALTAGAMSTMVLAVMSRAALGHSGRPLTAGPATVICFALVTFAAVVRVVAPLSDDPATGYLVSGLAWASAYGLFAAAYLRMLTGWGAGAPPQ